MYSKHPSPSCSDKNGLNIRVLLSNPIFFSVYTFILVLLSFGLANNMCRTSSEEYEAMEKKVRDLSNTLSQTISDRDEYKDQLEELQKSLAQSDHSKSNASTPLKSMLPPSARVSQQGKCKLSQTTSAIDDSTVSTIYCKANEPNPRSYKDCAVLFVRYKEKEKSVYISFHEYLGSDSIDVTVRFDSEQAETDAWSISTDSTAAFYKGDISRFVTKLCCSRKLVIRATPYNESPRTYTFDIENFSSVVAPVRHLFN